ncbi:MAG: hypothetical protein ABIR37_01730 [Candidatus Saccharimonadales bacterium]
MSPESSPFIEPTDTAASESQARADSTPDVRRFSMLAHSLEMGDDSATKEVRKATALGSFDKIALREREQARGL